MRRRLFFWRLQQRILKRRAASTVLLGWLRATSEVSRPHKMIRQYAHSVRRIQQAWRASWHRLVFQVELNRAKWLDADRQTRGLSEGAALAQEKEELEIRRQVLRADLRRRKLEFTLEILQWQKEMAAYLEWKAGEDIINEAQACPYLASPR